MDSLGGFHTAWHISHRSKMILDLIYGYPKPLEKAYYTKSKGRKEESIDRVFKKRILVKSWNNYFEITFTFSAQSLLVGTSVTCLRKSREPITALNVATYVTPLMVRSFWLCKVCTMKIKFIFIVETFFFIAQTLFSSYKVCAMKKKFVRWK